MGRAPPHPTDVSYAAPRLCLLDDPLSALDASTGKRCFDALLGDRGVLREAAVVLVTHGTHYLRRADRIIVLDVDGGFLVPFPRD